MSIIIQTTREDAQLPKLDKEFGVSLRVRQDDKHLRVLQMVGGRVKHVESWWGIWRQPEHSSIERRVADQHTSVVHLLHAMRVRNTVTRRVARVHGEINACS